MSEMPIARTVKHRGVAVTPPVAPWADRFSHTVEAMGPGPRAFVAAVIGLWPITLVATLIGGLCWMAAMGASP